MNQDKFEKDFYREKNAILSFFEKSWNISVKEGSIADVVEYVLCDGYLAGMVYKETHFEIEKGTLSIASSVGVKHISFVRETEGKWKRLDKHFNQFAGVNNALWKIQAEPKKYDVVVAFVKENEGVDFEHIIESFDGKPHKQIALSFEETLSSTYLASHHESNREGILSSFYAAIFRQGFRIGEEYTLSKYKPTLKKIFAAVNSLPAKNAIEKKS